jgi:AraC-like DNA-binding protein
MPANLPRFHAEWIPPAPAVRDVVDTYWAVAWDLAPGESVAQRIVDFPAVTLSIEAGDVPAPFVVTKVRPGVWSRVIAGRGSVFAIRLRPAGLAVLSDLDVLTLPFEQALTRENDRRAHDAMTSISDAGTAIDRAARADEVVLRLLHQRPLTPSQRRANAALDVLASRPRIRSGSSIAEELGTSERTLQRSLRGTVGLGPNDVARRIRVQEVVRRLSLPGADVSLTAAELGYVDQAHLINEFRTVTGTTPGRYIRESERAQSELRGTR